MPGTGCSLGLIKPAPVHYRWSDDVLMLSAHCMRAGLVHMTPGVQLGGGRRCAGAAVQHARLRHRRRRQRRDHCRPRHYPRRRPCGPPPRSTAPPAGPRMRPPWARVHEMPWRVCHNFCYWCHTWLCLVTLGYGTGDGALSLRARLQEGAMQHLSGRHDAHRVT